MNTPRGVLDDTLFAVKHIHGVGWFTAREHAEQDYTTPENALRKLKILARAGWLESGLQTQPRKMCIFRLTRAGIDRLEELR